MKVRETMREFSPSFRVYREIIKDIQKTGRACGYEEAQTRDQFIIMRHDIEFSIDRAFRLSKVESEMDFSSTNPFSRKNIQLLREMAHDGHTIGLHYHLNGQKDSVEVRDGVRD